MKKAARLTILICALGVFSLFQNCSRVAFSAIPGSSLAQGNNTVNNVPGTDTGDNPGSNPPGGDNTPPIMPPTGNVNPPSDGTETKDHDDDSEFVLCYLTNGNGESDRLGQGSATSEGVLVLDVSTAVPQDACMTPHACLDLVNAYLQHTGGNLDGAYSASAANPPVQYTAAKYNGVCGHNPNVSVLSDSQISKDLADLQSLHP